jgi:hypothetical protein
MHILGLTIGLLPTAIQKYNRLSQTPLSALRRWNDFYQSDFFKGYGRLPSAPGHAWLRPLRGCTGCARHHYCPCRGSSILEKLKA